MTDPVLHRPERGNHVPTARGGRYDAFLHLDGTTPPHPERADEHVRVAGVDA